MSRVPRQPRYVPPVIDPAQIRVLADRALAGDVVQPESIEELGAFLDELRRRGYELKRRTEGEQREAPWLFLIAPLSASVPAETDKG